MAGAGNVYGHDHEDVEQYLWGGTGRGRFLELLAMVETVSACIETGVAQAPGDKAA